MISLDRVKMAVNSMIVFFFGIIIGLFLMFYGEKLPEVPFKILFGLFGLTVLVGTWYLARVAIGIAFAGNKEYAEIEEALNSLRDPLPAALLPGFLLANGFTKELPLLERVTGDFLANSATISANAEISIRQAAIGIITSEIINPKKRQRLHSDKKRRWVIDSLLVRIRSGILFHPEVIKELASFVALVHLEGSPEILVKIAEAIAALIVSLGKKAPVFPLSSDHDVLLGIATRTKSSIPIQMERFARKTDLKVTAQQCPFELKLVSPSDIVDFLWALTPIAFKKAPFVRASFGQTLDEIENVFSSRDLHPHLVSVRDEINGALKFLKEISLLDLSNSLQSLARSLGFEGASSEVIDSSSIRIDQGYVVLLTIPSGIFGRDREKVQALILRTAIAYPFLPLILAEGRLNVSYAQSIREDISPDILYFWEREKLRKWLLSGGVSSELWGEKPNIRLIA